MERRTKGKLALHQQAKQRGNQCLVEHHSATVGGTAAFANSGSTASMCTTQSISTMWSYPAVNPQYKQGWKINQPDKP